MGMEDLLGMRPLTYRVGNLARWTVWFVKGENTVSAQGHDNLCVFSYLSLGTIVWHKPGHEAKQKIAPVAGAGEL